MFVGFVEDVDESERDLIPRGWRDETGSKFQRQNDTYRNDQSVI